jgi:RNA polymerase sigma-70 factor (ECF subfamily)
MPDTIQALDPELARSLEQHRPELTSYCHRMLRSTFEAEDAVQETLLRAWRSFGSFEGRSSVRAWLYRIAMNVCYDMLGGAERRARPVDLGPASSTDDRFGTSITEWRIELLSDARVAQANDDPAEAAEMHETVRLAFVAAVRCLPPKQRAALILKDVLGWKADEVAELLDTTVQSVNSALQRARSTITKGKSLAGDAPDRMDDRQKALLARYVDAFERYDVDALTSLLHEDATRIEVRREPKFRGRRRRRDRSSDGSNVHPAIDRPLSPVLQAVAVRYPVRSVGW